MRNLCLSLLVVLFVGAPALAQCEHVVLSEAERTFLSECCRDSAKSGADTAKAAGRKGMLDEYPSQDAQARAKLAREGFESLVKRGPAIGACLESMYLRGGVIASRTDSGDTRELDCTPSEAFIRLLRCVDSVRAREALYQKLSAQVRLAQEQKTGEVRGKDPGKRDPALTVWGVIASFAAMPDLEPDSARLSRAIRPSIALGSQRIWAEVVALAWARRDNSFLPLLIEIQERMPKDRAATYLAPEDLDEAIHFLQKDSAYFERRYQSALSGKGVDWQIAFRELGRLQEIGRTDLVAKHIEYLYPMALKDPAAARTCFEAFHRLGHDEWIKKAQAEASNPEVSLEASNALERIRGEAERRAHLKEITSAEDPAYKCP